MNDGFPRLACKGSLGQGWLAAASRPFPFVRIADGRVRSVSTDPPEAAALACLACHDALANLVDRAGHGSITTPRSGRPVDVRDIGN